MTIRIANTPASWGADDAHTDAPAYTYAQVLDQIAASYDGLELGRWGFLPTDPVVLQAELDKRGLRLVAAEVRCDFLDAAAVATAAETVQRVGGLVAALGGSCVVIADAIGRTPELIKQAGRRSALALNADEWDTFSAAVTQVGRALHSVTGLPVAFCPHGGTHIETPEETRRLLARTDPEVVGLCLDTGHIHFGGGDAVEAVKEWNVRLRLLHLRDYDAGIHAMARTEYMDYHAATAAGVFCALGTGTVDMAGVLAAAEANHYAGWAVVMQDTPIDQLDAPRAEAGRSRDYLRKLGY